MIKIGIVGSRKRDSNEDLNKVINTFYNLIFDLDDEIHIISGGASKGADRFAELLAERDDHHITIYRPQYNKYPGKIAPLRRNDYIAKDSDILIACVAKDRKGGTEDTIKKFKKYHPNRRLILVD
ncbi:MAG: hypothetical protein ACPKQO_03405 [Nitrososphaeraceae archaeon]